MKNKIIYTIVFALLLPMVIASCGKRVDKIHPELVGTWFSPSGSWVMTIRDNGYTIIEDYENNDNINMEVSGMATISRVGKYDRFIIQPYGIYNEKKYVPRKFRPRIYAYPYAIDTVTFHRDSYFPCKEGCSSTTLMWLNDNPWYKIE